MKSCQGRFLRNLKKKKPNFEYRLFLTWHFPPPLFPCLFLRSLLWPPPKKGIGESLGSDGVEVAGAGYIPPLRFKGITFGESLDQ